MSTAIRTFAFFSLAISLLAGAASAAEPAAGPAKPYAVVSLIGDHTGLSDADGNKIVTFKKCRDAEVVNYKALAATLSPSTIKQFTEIKEGRRSIKVY